jgi:hypothetical protein
MWQKLVWQWLSLLSKARRGNSVVLDALEKSNKCKGNGDSQLDVVLKSQFDVLIDIAWLKDGSALLKVMFLGGSLIC